MRAQIHISGSPAIEGDLVWSGDYASMYTVQIVYDCIEERTRWYRAEVTQVPLGTGAAVAGARCVPDYEAILPHLGAGCQSVHCIRPENVWQAFEVGERFGLPRNGLAGWLLAHHPEMKSIILYRL